MTAFGPPTPRKLDDVYFFAVHHERETAWRDNAMIGEIDFDEVMEAWQARKEDGPWLHMRSQAEARAYVCSRVPMPFWFVAYRAVEEQEHSEA